PKYMTTPFRIKTTVASNGVAIRYVRPSRKLRVIVSPHEGRLESVIFPYVGTANMFVLARTHGSSISHVRLANKDYSDSHEIPVGTNLVCPSDCGVAEIREDVEFSFEDVQFAWRIGKRDSVLYEYLLWIISPPAIIRIDSDFGSKQAASKFGDFLSWAIFDADNPRRFELDYAKFLLRSAGTMEEQFENLIMRTDIEEEELQQFLCNHRAILTSTLGYQFAQCKVGLTDEDIVDFLL